MRPADVEATTRCFLEQYVGKLHQKARYFPVIFRISKVKTSEIKLIGFKTYQFIRLLIKFANSLEKKNRGDIISEAELTENKSAC
jgi:hypothetical protein